MERRDFIKISALSGAMATLEGCRSAEKQLIRLIPEEELIPGSRPGSQAYARYAPRVAACWSG